MSTTEKLDAPVIGIHKCNYLEVEIYDDSIIYQCKKCLKFKLINFRSLYPFIMTESNRKNEELPPSRH